MEMMQGSKRDCVVLVPGPFQGHITPMLHLGKILHSRGFSIIVAYSEYNSPNPKNHPEFIFVSLLDNKSNLFSGNEKTPHDFLVSILTAVNLNCKAPLEEYLIQIMEKEMKFHGAISCIIYDPLMYFTEAVANKLNLPSIIMRSNTAAYVQSEHIILRLQAENSLPLTESLLQETIPEFQPFKFKDMSFPLTSEIPKALVEHWESIISLGSSRAIIWNIIGDLESSLLSQLQQHYQVPFFCIGPFHKFAPASQTSLLEEDNSCISWLDKQPSNSVLYVSLGSLASMDEKELIETAWGLIKSNQPFLWVVRSDSVSSSKWVENLPEDFQKRGLIVNWAPQMEVLQHSALGGFWSHCGWNSTLESISQGIPMICTPIFADQMVNARYLTQVWKIGLEMESRVLEREVIQKTIRRLMVDPEGKEMKKRAVNMKREVEICVEKEGPSYKSLDELTEFISSLPLKR